MSKKDPYRTRQDDLQYKNWKRSLMQKKKNGNWIENGCSRCGKGMTRHIYEFQMEHRNGDTICSTCDKKERLKSLKK